MKKTLLFLFLAAVAVGTRAQSEANTKVPLIFTVGPEIGFPVGNNAAEYSVYFGASVQMEYMASERLALTANTGYLNYSYKTVAGNGNQGFIPLLAGVKFYISTRAFLHMQAGAAFGTSSIADQTNGVYLTKGTFFAYSPGIGHKFGKKLEGEFKFLGVSKSGNHLNALGLRLAYTL